MAITMTESQKYYLGAVAVFFAVLAGALVAYPYLPASIPQHWNAHGQIDGWGPKWWLFVFGPGTVALTVLVFAALPWLSPKKFEVESFYSTYLYIMIVVVAMMAYINLLMLAAALDIRIDVTRAILGGASLQIALLGNVLGKVRRNFFVGIRTPWTIASEPVWNATHRLAAKTLFAAGLAGLVFAILHAPFWLPVAVILVGALWPVLYSLMLYKQLERRGAL